jgi:hypothetical protein
MHVSLQRCFRNLYWTKGSSSKSNYWVFDTSILLKFRKMKEYVKLSSKELCKMHKLKAWQLVEQRNSIQGREGIEQSIWGENSWWVWMMVKTKEIMWGDSRENIPMHFKCYRMQLHSNVKRDHGFQVMCICFIMGTVNKKWETATKRIAGYFFENRSFYAEISVSQR